MNNPQIELNVPIYDPLNDRYITPVEFGCDQLCYICRVEEMPDYPDEYVEMRYLDYEFMGFQLFTQEELLGIMLRRSPAYANQNPIEKM